MPFIIKSTEINGLPVTTMGGCGSFSVAKTFDCGQTFRFDPVSQDKIQTFFPDSASVYAVAGTALGKTVMFAESPVFPAGVPILPLTRTMTPLTSSLKTRSPRRKAALS